MDNKEKYYNYSIDNGKILEEIKPNIDIENTLNEICEECKLTNKDFNNYCTSCGSLLNK